MGHAGKLWYVECHFPLQSALGKHLQHRLDQFRSIQAAKSHKDNAGKAVQIVGKHASATVRTEVAIEPLAGFSDVVERLRLAAKQCKIIFWHTKKIAVAPPEAFLQSLQWHSATKVGSVLNSNLTAPQAHCAVYFLPMPFTLFGPPIWSQGRRSGPWRSVRTRPGSGR